MAEDSSGTSQPSPPSGRTGPVLVPQASLLGKPDISLARSVMTAGSRESSRIHLVSRSISQYHALFINSTGTVAVCDLASRTGVLVNAKPVKYAELKNGDLVQLGKFLFRFRAPKAEAIAAPPPPAVLDAPGDLPISLVDTKRLIIGRRETCDLPLTDDTEVSTLHAVLFQHDGGWIIRDLDSRTGTRLNGIRIHQAKLAFGDTIKIGKSTFNFAPATEVLSTPTDADADLDFAPSPVVSPVQAEASTPTESVEAEPLDIADALATEPLDLDLPAEITATANVELPLNDLGEPEPASDALELEPTEPAAAEPAVSDAADALELEPIDLEPPSETVAVSNVELPLDRPGEPEELADAPEAAPAAEEESLSDLTATVDTDLPPEPAGLPAAASDDSLAATEEPAADADVLDLGTESTFDLPLELDVADTPPTPEATADAELPAEPAELSTAEADDTLAAESPLTVDEDPVDTDVLDLGSASTFDLPLELDVAETPPLPESKIDELPAAAEFKEPPAAEATEPVEEIAPPELTEAAASPPPLQAVVEPPVEEADDGTETIDFGEPLPPEPPPEPVKPTRKRTPKKAAAPKAPKEPKESKPRRGGRKKSVAPLVMDVVETMATDPLPELPVVPGGALLPEVVAAMEVGDGLPPVESIETAAMLAITASSADEPTLTMTESMPATPSELDAGPAAVTMSNTALDEPVDTHDMAQPADDDVVITTHTGLTTEQLLVESDTDLTPAETPVADENAVHEPSDLIEEPASLHTAASEPFAELAALGEDDEFVAIPDPEPADDADELLTQASDETPSLSGFEEPIAAEAAEEALDAPADELLEDALLDEAPLEEVPPEEALPEIVPAAEESSMLGDDVAPVGPDSAGPPIFGFDFGGGSFLGGMPLSLEQPRTAAEMTPAATSPPPPAPSLHAEFEPAAPAASQPAAPTAPPMTAPAALVDMDESSLLSYDEPYTTESASVPMSAVVNTDNAPLTAFDEPMTAPSTLAPDDQTLTSTTSRPAINTLADEVAIPPLTSRAADEAVAPRKSITTAFDGLAGGLGAASSTMNVDVFSQMAPPINDELFGSRGDKPEDVVLPNKQPEIPPSPPRRDPPQVQIPPIDRTNAGRPAAAETYRDEEDDRRDERDYHRTPPDRFARLPTLALLMLLCLIAAGMMIYFFLPPPIDVVGTLTFANLSKQPVSNQRQFAINQVQRLESGDVRNVARSIVTTKGIGTGFLDDDLEFAKVTANADWDGDVMTLHQTGTDEYAARARLTALLEALSRKDADLNDALASARAAAAAAHDAVTNQQQVISRIRADRETQVRIGDSAPRLEDVAVLERKANQLDAAWVAAKTRRADAQLILDRLRQMDPATATDPKDDPLLAELRTHQQEADVRLAVARATTGKAQGTQPAADIDMAALTADVSQTRAAIDKRLAQLQAEKTQTPEQRIASRQAAIESQSVKLATLQAAETDAATAAQAAAIAARDQRAMLDAGRMASIHVEDLIHRQEAAEQTLKELSDDQAAKDNAVNLCVQVAATPKVDTRPGRDVRPVSYAMTGGAILLLFGVIAVASTRPVETPVHIPSAAVPAAPLPVFGANRKPRPDPKRPREAPTPKPAGTRE